MTEAELLDAVISTARLLHWRVAHFRPGRTAHGGWRTAVQGDGVGFPDLLLARERVLYAELKVGRGKLSAEQEAWLVALRDAGQEIHVWRDVDWLAGVVERVLRA